MGGHPVPPHPFIPQNCVFGPEELKKFNESNIFQVSEIFPGVLSIFFRTAAFNTDIFQGAILYQNEGQLALYPVI